MRITLDTFGGTIPRLAAELLPADKAQTAQNCKLSNGLLRPWFNDSEEFTCQNTGTIRTIYRHAGAYWLEWEADVDVVPGPISADTTGRLYWTGHGIPKKSNTAQMTTGSGAMPINFYPLAVPFPKNAPTVAAGSGGTGDLRNITYVYRNVTIWGEVGAPSPASEIVSAKNGQTVSVSGMTQVWQAGTAYDVGDFVFASQLPILDETGDPILDEEGDIIYDAAGNGSEWIFICVVAGTSSGGSEPTWNNVLDGDTVDGGATWRAFKNVIASKDIYRFNTGNSTATYQYVGTIDVGETSFTDDITDANLGDPLDSEDYDQPPIGLLGLCYLGNGIMLGFSGKDLYISAAYLPYAWPYSVALAHPIVAIKSLGGTAIIITEGHPYLATGTDPASLATGGVVPLPSDYAGVSKRGAASCAIGILYPSAGGLVLAKVDGSTSLLTEKHYTVDEWEDLYPTTLHGHIHDNRYFGFYSYGTTEGCIVLDLTSGELTTLQMYCDAAWVDPEEDAMYFIKEAVAIEDEEGFEITDESGETIEQEN